MISDHTGNTAVANVDRELGPMKKRMYREGISTCKKLGCVRIVDGKCYGWKDPLFMWEHYGECPYFSDDKDLIKKIDESCENYQKYMDGKGEAVGKKACISY